MIRPFALSSYLRPKWYQNYQNLTLFMWCVYVPQKAAARFPFLWVSRHLILQRREGIRDQVSDLTSNTSNKFSTKVICWTLCAKKTVQQNVNTKEQGNSWIVYQFFEQLANIMSRVYLGIFCRGLHVGVL